MELTVYQIRNAHKRAIEKLERQKAAAAATEAEVQLWEHQLQTAQESPGRPSPKK